MTLSVPHRFSVLKLGRRRVRASSHAVVVPDRATEQEAHAAKDLIVHLRCVIGEQLPLRRESRAAGRIPIFVGRAAALARLIPQATWNTLGDEGILLRTEGDALFLAGGRRGVLYACYTFLEDNLGVHWLAPDCTEVPRGKTFVIRGLNQIYVPPLEYREPFAFCGFDPDWSVRNKSNGFASRLDAPRGGGTVYEGFVHTFYRLVPPETHFASHPEYFSELDGRRRHERAQLCLTNTDLLDVMVRAVRERLRENPGAAIVSISQNDWDGACQCARCRAVDAEEGSPAGALLRFVNGVAERLEPEFPGVAFDTLAYRYTRKPPRVTRPRPNVIVRLCSIECSFAQPLGTGLQNRDFRRDVEGWSRICKRLYVWDYVTDFTHYLQPHPNLRVLQPNIRFLVRHGVRGIFEQGGFQSPGGEFQELRTWLLAKLLWNPESNVNALLRTFLEGYYGPAAQPLRRYITLMHDAVEKAGTFLGCYSPPTASFLTDAVRARADRLFDLAESSVHGQPVLLKRVQQARLPLQYLHIVRGLSRFRETRQALRPAGRDVKKHLVRFARVARAAGVTHVREGAPDLEAKLASWRQQASGLAIVRLANPRLELAVLPALGGRIWRFRDFQANRDWLAPDPQAGLPPDDGGYEEYSEPGYRSSGWSEPYRVCARTDRGLVLETDLENGLRLTRRIELDPRKPLVRIVSTLANRSRQPRLACLRVHPAFAIGDWDRTAVRLRVCSGAWRRQRLTLPPGGDSHAAKRFEGPAMPAGGWALEDRQANVALLNRFRQSQVNVCYLSWSARSPRVHLELWSPHTTLKPGARLTIEHEYEVVHAFDGRRGTQIFRSSGARCTR
jgi:hypothetical protein